MLNHFYKDSVLIDGVLFFVLVGQSAGSINLASSVYNSSEYKADLDKAHNYVGTDIKIEHHFLLDTSNFDNDEMLYRKCYDERV